MKTTFLKRYLTKDIYMKQPKGFVSEVDPYKVCKLNKSIYSLKQVSHNWILCFDEVIKNENEPCNFKKVNRSKISFLVLYVGGILLIGNHIGMLISIKAWLSSTLSWK